MTTAGLAEPMDEMSEDQLLALAAARAQRIRDDKTELLRVAYQIAVLHDVDGLGHERDLPGRERARRYGGEGTPEMLEFAAATLAARMGVTTWTAEQLVADAMDLHHRTPDLWALLLDGLVDPDYARVIVKKTRSLSPDAAVEVAAAVAVSADGRIPWGRFEEVLKGAIAAADPVATAEKERRAAQTSFAGKLRDEGDGVGAYYVRGPIWMINQIAAVVSAYSTAIRDDYPGLDDDERSLLALLILLTPGADQDPESLKDLMPVVQLFVHMYAGDDSTGIARLEGHGPVTHDWVREHLGTHCRFKIQPVLDIEGLAPVDAYEIPDRHRQAVHLMSPADTFPHGSNLSRSKQVDHTRPYERHGPPGQSGIGNYGPLTTQHHRIKTHGRWDVRQPFPGIYVWRDPHGATYLVDNTGTRRLPQPAEALPLVVEIYRGMPALDLDWVA